MVDEAALPRPRWCYLEIPASNPHTSADFYEAVFGWQIRHRDSDRPSFNDASGAVSGAFVTGREASRTPGLLPYIWVDDLDAALNAAVSAGGAIVDDRHLDVEPDGEWIATFQDPAGNVIGLYQVRARE